MTNIVIFADILVVNDFGIEFRLLGGAEHRGFVTGPHGWFSVEGTMQ
jgi:hypothetical protein